MSSSGAANSLDDESKSDFHNLQPLENKQIARERRINHKKLLIAICEMNIVDINNLLKQVDINYKDRDGHSALHFAARTGDTKIERERIINHNKFLIAISESNIVDLNNLLKQVDINSKDRDGYSALHWAVETSDIKVIEILMNSGADLHSKNSDNETAIDIAKKLNRMDVVNILEASLHHVNKPKVTEKQKAPDQQEKTSSQDQEIWINPVHGYIYQLKVLMLFLHRSLSCKYSFRLGTKIKEDQKFDDLVFEYVEDNKKVYRLLQAKHKFDESKKITVDKLLTETKGDYSLAKYFYSFQACKKNSFFKDGIIKDVIICTNIDFDWDDLKRFDIEMKKIQEKDNILDIESSEKEPTRYKFTDSMLKKLKWKLKPGESDDDIKNFLNHLVFAVNQPNEEELGQIVKTEIGKEIGYLDTENAYNKLLIKLMDLSLGKNSNMFLSHNEGKKFFDDLKEEIPIWFNIQEPVGSFTGRFNCLKQIHNSVKKSYVCISGMGGMGKTELVRKYIASYGQEYNSQVVWINAETYRSAAKSFQQLASDKLNISLSSPDGKVKHITSIVTEIYQSFPKGKSLFIFDNAKKYKCENEFDCGIDQFLPCLPDNCAKLNIIITSGNQKWPENFKTIVLKAFNRAEARELVEKVLTFQSDEDKKVIVELCEKMQFLPLALQQAVAYIKMENKKLTCIEANFGISSYLERFSQMTQELLGSKFLEDSDSNYDKSVFVTWNITMDTLKQKENGQDAIDILNLISYFLPDNIPIDLLLIFSTNKEKLSSAIGLLKQYSIVSVQHKALSVHRLVQQVTRIKLQKQDNEIRILENALKLLNKNNINCKNEDHVISIWKFARRHNQLLEAYLLVAASIVLNLHNRDSIEEAISIGNESSKVYNALSRDIIYLPNYLFIRNNMAMCFLRKGDYKTALEVFQEILKFQTATLGFKPSDIQVLNTKSNLAFVLEHLGRFKEALESYFEQLDELKAKYNESHPKILITKSKICVMLAEEGRSKEASSILQEIDVHKSSLDDRDEDTLALKSNIAKALGKLDRAKEAFEILKKVRSEKEATLPKNNFSSCVTRLRLADVLMKQGKYSSALEIFQESLDIQKENFGEDHPETIEINVHIATILKMQGEYEKALNIFKSALNKRQNILGIEHHKTLFIQADIADVLMLQGKYLDSIELYESLLEKQIRILGNSHPNTFATRRSIVTILAKQKKIDAALKLSLKVFQDSTRVFGENHRSTLTDKVNVGCMLLYKGSTYYKGLAILKEALEAQEISLGKNHVDCQITRRNIASLRPEQIKFDRRQTDYNIAQCKQALEQGADINQPNEEGSTMLHMAINYADKPMVNFLLQRGAEIFVTDAKGDTPLHIAASKGQEKFANLLLRKLKPGRLKDFVDAKNIPSRSTALHVASKGGHFGIVKCLLKNHATFCTKDKNGKTPLDLSTDAKVTSFLKMGREFFEDLKQVDAIKVVKKLEGLPSEEFLAVANMRNEQGSTLAQAAILNKHKQVAAEILKMLQLK